MKNTKLVIPSAEYLQSYLEACREFQRIDNNSYRVHDPDTFEKWRNTIFEEYEKARRGIDLQEGYVPASVFWLVGDGEFIGTGSIRHALTPALEKFGGHIGYAVRPSKQNRGYGTRQLEFLLKEASKLGIGRALVTCDDDNVGSYRVMEKNGGIYQDTVESIINGTPRCIRRYWIDTTP